jgi:arylsulfatase A-like enzyme
MADEFVKQAGKFIAANADKPFFLYFASQDVHVPRTPHPRFRGKSKLTYRGDAMVQLDWSVGAVVEILDKHGLKENTIVIFSSDNGPVYDDGYKDGTTVKPKRGEVDRGHDASGPYRGGKYEISEGGTRVPLIVRWPERIRPGKSAALVTQVDFVASFAKLLEVELPEGAGIDSQDCLAALLGEDAKGDTYIVEESGGTIALRKGDWKVVTGAKTRKGKKGPQLYDLSTDVAEKKNLAGERPDLARTLADTLARIRRGKGLRHEKLEK